MPRRGLKLAADSACRSLAFSVFTVKRILSQEGLPVCQLPSIAVIDFARHKAFLAREAHSPRTAMITRGDSS